MDFCFSYQGYGCEHGCGVVDLADRGHGVVYRGGRLVVPDDQGGEYRQEVDAEVVERVGDAADRAGAGFYP